MPISRCVQSDLDVLHYLFCIKQALWGTESPLDSMENVELDKEEERILRRLCVLLKREEDLSRRIQHCSIRIADLSSVLGSNSVWFNP